MVPIPQNGPDFDISDCRILDLGNAFSDDVEGSKIKIFPLGANYGGARGVTKLSEFLPKDKNNLDPPLN